MATMAATTFSDQPATVSDDRAWRAVVQRDRGFDGSFVYAVRSTGVYCKPSCASRRPLRTNIRFFGTPSDAEAAGFRACRRCRPADASFTGMADRTVERAREFLDRNPDRVVSLHELASHVKLSPSHLQRSFKRATGLSPKQYQDAQRVKQLKSRLRAGDTVSRATYEAGFGSSSRVYERADRELGMTPAAFRRGGRGVSIAYTVAATPIGRVLVATTERGVCAVELGATDEEVIATLERDFPHATIARGDEQHTDWVTAVVNAVRDSRNAVDARVPLDMQGTTFQQRVWRTLRDIPAGSRRSYAEVAKAIGQPSASRAVARACATNRLAVIVPCHRVVRGDGDLAGYKWGTERKKRLLDKESR
jgi:AraC family transcriptional regulator of adaptative response/methylated-DNA-[protein]-cysteine methyltransferase